MPKELRKRGKRHKKDATENQIPAAPGQEQIDEGPSSGPSWIIPRANAKQVDPDAPFGYVDPEIKAYFRTVDDQLKEWQESWNEGEGDGDIDPNENRRMFLMAALQEISGKERELATDPECAAGVERMIYSMDDFVRRVFMDRLAGSYELLITHRFSSHVIQTLLAVAKDTTARETRGVLPKVEDSKEEGQLRTLTQLILDFSEEILPSLPALIMDQFASHVVRALFLLLCPQLFRSDLPHKSQAFVRSRKSAAWKAKQGPFKSIFGDGPDKGKTSAADSHPPEFRDAARKFVTTLRTNLDANEVRSLAANKVACPVLQMSLEIESDQGLSDEPGSLMDHVLVGLISAQHDDPSVMPEPSDYLATLLRDPTSSHLLETLVSRCPAPVFDVLWSTYFEQSFRKLAMHPVANFVIAKALERAAPEQLNYALGELRDSLSKLRQTRIGILRALVERAATLGFLEAEVCEAICFAFQVSTEEDRKGFVLYALTLKSTSEYSAALKAKAVALQRHESQEEVPKTHSGKEREGAQDPLEPTTTGALLLQSLLRLHAPHNELIFNSIESLPPETLLTLVHHPAASRVLDAIIDGPNIPSRARRALLRTLEAQFADVIDDRIGARVGARCWAAADPYFKEKLARALLPHAVRLAGSPHARFFTRGLGLSLLQRKPEEWRRLHATPSSSATTMSPKSGSNKSTAAPTAQHTHAREKVADDVSTSDLLPLPARARKKRKRGATATDEIDELFDDAFGRNVTRTALKQQEPVQSQSKPETTKQTKHGGVGANERTEEVGLGIVVDAIKAVPRNEGKKKKRRAAS